VALRGEVGGQDTGAAADIGNGLRVELSRQPQVELDVVPARILHVVQRCQPWIRVAEVDVHDHQRTSSSCVVVGLHG
jgi:hypothetical protein